MANYEYDWPNCWIRGDISPSNIQGDEVRQATQSCPHRKAKPSHSIFGGNDHICTHPGIKNKDEVEGAKERYGGIMFGGGVDEFKTFCVPVDMHLTSLGEKSELAIEGKFKDITDETNRSSLPDPRDGILNRLLCSNNG
jgi:hypothetical protein